MSELEALRHTRRWSHQGGSVRRYWRSLIAASATVVVLAIVAPSLPVPFVGQFPVLGILAVLVGIVALPERGMGWAAGLEGKVLTARAIEQLKIEGLVVLHDRRAPGMTASIDHIVIGLNGMATVTTESFPDGLRAGDGELDAHRNSSYLSDEAMSEAIAVAVALTDELERRRLKVWPILCVDRVRQPFAATAPNKVWVVDGRGLVRLLRKAPRLLSAEDARELARVADDRLRPVAAPLPQLYGPLPMAAQNDRAVIPSRVPSAMAADGDQSFMPPVRRAQIEAAREARARATDQRMYWHKGGLAQGKAPPTIRPGDPDEG